MAGLLDLFGSTDDAQRAGLLMLAAAGPRAQPASFGQRLLESVQQFDAGTQQKKDRAAQEEERRIKAQLIQAQISETLAQAAQRNGAVDKQKEIARVVDGILGGQPSSGSGIRMGGVSQPQNNPGGLAGVPIEQIAALKAMGGPDLLEQWKAAQTGVKMDPGAFYRGGGRGEEFVPDIKSGIGFSDGKMQALPGALDTLGGIAGATKGAEARAGGMYRLVQGEGPDGKPGFVGTETSIADRFNFPQSSQPPQMPPQSPVMDRVRAAMARYGDTSANFNIGGVTGTIGGQQGAQPGGFVPTGQGPREKTVNDAITLGNQAFMKDRYSPALEGGDAATQTIASVQAARQALNALGKTGWGTPTVAAAAAVLGTLGVPQAERFASSAQMFQSAAMGKLWTTLNAAKGPQTEGDADRAAKTFARLENTPQANGFILDMTQATAERERLKAQYFREALPLAQQSGDLQEIERRWSRIAPSIFSMPMMKRWAQ